MAPRLINKNIQTYQAHPNVLRPFLAFRRYTYSIIAAILRQSLNEEENALTIENTQSPPSS
jgi:hypothetical protein